MAAALFSSRGPLPSRSGPPGQNRDRTLPRVPNRRSLERVPRSLAATSTHAHTAWKPRAHTASGSRPPPATTRRPAAATANYVQRSSLRNAWFPPPSLPQRKRFRRNRGAASIPPVVPATRYFAPAPGVTATGAPPQRRPCPRLTPPEPPQPPVAAPPPENM